MLSMKTYGEIHVSSNNLVPNVLLQLLSLKSQNCEVYFSNVFTLEMRLSTSPAFVTIYFCFYFFYLLSYALTLIWPKSLSRG